MMRVIGQVFFDPEDDQDGAARALRRAGFDVRVSRDGLDDGWAVMYIAMDCDSDTVVFGQPTDNDDKLLDAVITEINKIVRPFGGDALHCQDIAQFAADNVPSDDELFAPQPRPH
jgi:hypothetical protein